MAPYTKLLIVGIALSLTASCAFFEQPVDKLPDIAPSSTATDSVPQASTATSTPTETNTPTPSPTQPATAPDSTEASGLSYLVVTPIENLPEEATNIGVVHFTKKNTKRALALCKVLTQGLQVVDIQDLPVNASNVALWPVANDNAGSSCIEMLTDYEPIDITVEAGKKIKDSADGPFLLTQHMSSGTRMIYDMSFISQGALQAAVGEWTSLMGADPANWPPYRRAR